MSTDNPFEMTATEGAGNLEIAPAGAHAAVLVGLIDMGTHTEIYKDEKKGEKTTDVRKVLFVWELPGKGVSGMKGVNHLLCKTYNLSFGPMSGLRKLIEAWSGKTFPTGEKFNLTKLLGYHCLLTLVHGKSERSGRDYCKISSVAPLPAEMGKPKALRKPMQWLIGGDIDELAWVPFLYGEKIADVVKRSKELQVQQAVGAKTSGHDYDHSDEAPF